MSGPPSADPRLVVGCMTGTSIDALDAALVRIHARGLAMHADFVRGVSRPLGDLAPRLRALAEQTPLAAGDIAHLSRDFALAHAAAVREVVRGEPCHLVAVHGQTVFHAPPASWQMFNAPVLAHELRAPVVFDLRAADLAAGGQGAPITPLADWILFRSERRTAVVNLGGFCNATVLPASRHGAAPADAIAQIEGFDVCACNHLLDHIARALLNRPYDEDGRAARSGSAHPRALEALRAHLVSQSQGRRSLGTGDELGAWIEQWRTTIPASDLAATACAAIAATLADRLRAAGGPQRILIAGGGARNHALVAAIRSACAADVETTGACAVPIEFREAAEMAVLGALCQDRVPITLSRATGVQNPPVAGVWAGH